MLPIINGKQIIDCSEQDLTEILNNSDYRESEFLDYKSMFSVDLYQKSDKRFEQAKAELRNDVCAFANANGGYLIFGVKEEGGIPAEICGIEIKDSTERFEMRLKNYLQTIQPKMPQCSFRFIQQENGRYIVIILVLHDAFAPYFHVENEKDYRFYKRVGNDKRPIAYTELRNMFIQSTALEKEIERFRKERIEFFRNQGFGRFMLIHVIPDTFTDSSYNKLVYILNRQRNYSLSNMFNPIEYLGNPLPTVDGLLRKPVGESHHHECRLFNNFVGEAFNSLKGEVQKIGFSDDALHFPWRYVLERVLNFTYESVTELRKHISTNRLFICISIVGCMGVSTQMRDNNITISTIDRDVLLIAPCVFDDIANEDANEDATNRLKLDYFLSLGITANDAVKKLMDEYIQ